MRSPKRFAFLTGAVGFALVLAGGPAFASSRTRPSRPRSTVVVNHWHTYRQQLGRAATTGGVALNVPYSKWAWPAPGTFDDTEERMTIQSSTTAGAPYFWAYQFGFGGGDGGYVGLQDDGGNNADKIAIVSIWGATAARGPNACWTFNEDGIGLTCRIDPYRWLPGRTYEVELTRTDADGSGTWWKATVRDTATGATNEIGELRVPLDWGGVQGLVSFTEYFGDDPASCSVFPKSRAVFAYPTADSGTTAITSHTHSFQTGHECATSITDVSGGDLQKAPK